MSHLSLEINGSYTARAIIFHILTKCQQRQIRYNHPDYICR